MSLPLESCIGHASSKMLTATSANDMRPTSTTLESSNLVSSHDGGQLPTVHEVAPRTRNRNSRFREATSTVSLPLETHRPRDDRSRDASPASILDPIPGDKFPAHTRRSLKHHPPGTGTRERSAWSKELTSSGDETYRDSMADAEPAPSPARRPTKRGWRTVIRRLFGRTLAKNRISMPAPAQASHRANVSVSPSPRSGWWTNAHSRTRIRSSPPRPI